MDNPQAFQQPDGDVKRAVLELANGGAKVVRHTSSRWKSLTFQGTREILVLHFIGSDWDAQFTRFSDELCDHEFVLKGKLVADACVTGYRPIQPRGIAADVELLVLADDITSSSAQHYQENSNG